MPLYDSPPPCVPDVRRSPSPTGLPLARAIGNEVSRFSCIQFRGVPGVSDYVGPPPGSRVWRRDSVLPSPSDDRVGDLSSWFSKLNTLPVAAPVYASDRISRCATQDSGSGWIRCSFPVGLFHSQLHAGLSRRSACPTIRTSTFGSFCPYTLPFPHAGQRSPCVSFWCTIATFCAPANASAPLRPCPGAGGASLSG